MAGKLVYDLGHKLDVPGALSADDEGTVSLYIRQDFIGFITFFSFILFAFLQLNESVQFLENCFPSEFGLKRWREQRRAMIRA